jgi:hypothetical protein
VLDLFGGIAIQDAAAIVAGTAVRLFRFDPDVLVTPV